jgi:hypothetical protein
MGSGGTEAGTRGVKIPHHLVPAGKNREEILGLFLHAPMAMMGGVLVGFVLLLLLTPGPLPNIGFYNPLFRSARALLGSLINYRTRNRSANWVGAIGGLYLVSVTFFRIFLDFGNRHISEI